MLQSRFLDSLFSGAIPWHWALAWAAGSAVLATLCHWAIELLDRVDSEPEPAAEPLEPLIGQDARCGFIHVSRTTKSGKGRCKTAANAMVRLANLRSQSLPRRLTLNQLAGVQASVLAGIDASSNFANCSHIIVSGDGIRTMEAAVRSACPGSIIMRAWQSE